MMACTVVERVSVLGELRRRAAVGDASHRRLEDRPAMATTFFCSWSGAPLTENAVGLMVRRLRQGLTASGFEVRIHPRFFRHHFLTEKALDGENPSMVRRWAGHKSSEMAEYYFGLAEAKVTAIKQRQSTLAGLTLLLKGATRPWVGRR